MNIAIALNRKYFTYTYVMLTSLFHNNPNEEITCYVLHSELTSEDIVAFSQLAYKYGGHIVSVPIDRSAFAGSLPTSDMWSIETYYRLMLLDVLPASVDRLLYIDVDTIIIGELGSFYNSEFGEKHFVVCEDSDPVGIVIPERAVMFTKQFEQGYRYFNAGIMLWDIERLRGHYNFKRYMSTAAELNYNFVAPDQDILNYTHWQQVAYCDWHRYNLYERNAHNQNITYDWAANNTAIIHYTGYKPWSSERFHYDLERYWWEYAAMTPYYNELCSEFVDAAMSDSTLELYTQDLLKQIALLKDNLDKSLSMNNKLMELLR